jgi:hypothetical protein
LGREYRRKSEEDRSTEGRKGSKGVGDEYVK